SACAEAGPTAARAAVSRSKIRGLVLPEPVMRTFAASLAVLALAHAAAAQITEKEAVAEVKASTKAELKTFKSAGADALKTLNSDLADFEGTLTDATTTDTVLGTLANKVDAFIASVNTAFTDAVQNVDGATANTLDTLANGGSLDGAFPV